MGVSLGSFTEIMDQIFGGAEKRGIIQGIALLVVGIVLYSIPAVIAAGAAAMLLTDPTQYYTIMATVTVMSWMYWVGEILIVLGIVGIIWYILRKMEWVEV